MNIDDPMERMIAEALKAASVIFSHESDRVIASPPLDFYLPDRKVYIEVKQFHSDRIGRQMSQAPDIIVAQGRGAVTLLSDMIRTFRE